MYVCACVLVCVFLCTCSCNSCPAVNLPLTNSTLLRQLLDNWTNPAKLPASSQLQLQWMCVCLSVTVSLSVTASVSACVCLLSAPLAIFSRFDALALCGIAHVAFPWNRNHFFSCSLFPLKLTKLEWSLMQSALPAFSVAIFSTFRLQRLANIAGIYCPLCATSLSALNHKADRALSLQYECDI